MFDYKDFKERELYPAMFPHIPEILDGYQWTDKGYKWVTKVHFDTETDDSGKQFTVNVTEDFPNIVHDFGRGGKNISVFDLRMQMYECDYKTAFLDIVEICGLSDKLPKKDDYKTLSAEERAERDFAFIEQQENNAAQKVFHDALYSDRKEAKQALEYFRKRKWSLEKILELPFGLYVAEMNRELPEEWSLKLREEKDKHGKTLYKAIGRYNVLSFAYIVNGQIKSFIFRTMGKEGTKYLNVEGTKIDAFCGIRNGQRSVTVVEGILDYYAAKAHGARDVVAAITSSGNDAQINDAISRGVKQFTLLLDNDEAGLEGARRTAERLRDKKVLCFVGKYPENCKDLDDYFTKTNHTLDDYKKMIEDVEHGNKFITRAIILSHLDKDGNLSDKQREDLKKEIVRHLSTLSSDEDKKFALAPLEEEFSNLVNLNSESLIKESVTISKKENTTSLEAKKEPLTAAPAADKSSDDVEKQKRYKRRHLYSTSVDVFNDLSKTVKGRPSGYIYSSGAIGGAVQSIESIEHLTFNTGLSFICGGTGHGKTSMLDNIVLYEATRNLALSEDSLFPVGRVIYYSQEVNRRKLLTDLICLFVNDTQLGANGRNPLGAIREFFRVNKGKSEKEYDLTMFSHETYNAEKNISHAQNFVERLRVFIDRYILTGAITIIDETYTAETLVKDVEEAIKEQTPQEDNKGKVTMTVIDYVQLLYSEKKSNSKRTEEIKFVVQQLRDLSEKRGVPIVLAAQFNREVISPLNLLANKIGEAGDLERIADTVVGIFNLKQLLDSVHDRNQRQELLSLLKRLGLDLIDPNTGKEITKIIPLEGILLTKIIKRRDGMFPVYNLLSFEGKTKYIANNANLEIFDPEFSVLNQYLEIPIEKSTLLGETSVRQLREASHRVKETNVSYQDILNKVNNSSLGYSDYEHDHNNTSDNQFDDEDDL